MLLLQLLQESLVVQILVGRLDGGGVRPQGVRVTPEGLGSGQVEGLVDGQAPGLVQHGEPGPLVGTGHVVWNGLEKKACSWIM
jgi:hypothetical protein